MANDAEDEIFGGDSDLSDVGEEDILPQAERTPTPGLEDASGGEEYGDDYVAEDVFGEKKWRKPKKSACAFYLFLSWMWVLQKIHEIPVWINLVRGRRRMYLMSRRNLLFWILEEERFRRTIERHCQACQTSKAKEKRRRR
ncbi:hypothetical protein BT69DRAFT_974470 [Atractiella rhizophila]|nr:hypothetical protein BT69DRAFT_974470 [Atractiella rhizophila]